MDPGTAWNVGFDFGSWPEATLGFLTNYLTESGNACGLAGRSLHFQKSCCRQKSSGGVLPAAELSFPSRAGALPVSSNLASG